MNRQHLVLLLALGLVACGRENQASIEITGRAAPGDALTCTFAAGGLKLGNPVLFDSALPLAINVELYVQNHLQDPSIIDPSQRPQANDWRPEAARIRLNPKAYVDRYGPNPALPGVRAEAVIPLTVQSITPSGGEAPQPVTVLSTALAVALAGTAPATPGDGTVTRNVVGITLLGRTAAGASLDSAEWYLPVDVCPQCVTVPACLAGQTPVLVTCPVGQVLPSCR